eukprot:2594807-Alexandrium_andersonii.AAC.1
MSQHEPLRPSCKFGCGPGVPRRRLHGCAEGRAGLGPRGLGRRGAVVSWGNCGHAHFLWPVLGRAATPSWA